MGRRPKPTHLKLIEGNPGKRKLNQNEPIPDHTAPRCPKQLSGESRKAWKYLVSELGKMGILASSDQAEMTAYCDAWGRWIIAKERLAGECEVITTDKGNKIQNPWLGISNMALRDLSRAGGNLGLNPVQRTRIHMDKPQPKTKRERLLG